MLSLTHAPRSCTNPRMHPALEEYYPSKIHENKHDKHCFCNFGISIKKLVCKAATIQVTSQQLKQAVNYADYQTVQQPVHSLHPCCIKE